MNCVQFLNKFLPMKNFLQKRIKGRKNFKAFTLFLLLGLIISYPWMLLNSSCVFISELKIVPRPLDFYLTSENLLTQRNDSKHCNPLKIAGESRCTWTCNFRRQELCGSKVPYVVRHGFCQATIKPFVRSIQANMQIGGCSQLGQDGILFEIFRHIGVHSSYFVEFGARRPDILNSAHLRISCDWNGLLMDADKTLPSYLSGRELIHNEKVDPDNINELFAKYRVPKIYDLLTLDFDMNEYWVWKAIDQSKFIARVVAIEIGVRSWMNESSAVVYQRHNKYTDWSAKTSPLATLLIARRKGYCLVSGALWHLIFVYCSLLSQSDQNMDLHDLPWDVFTYKDPGKGIEKSPGQFPPWIDLMKDETEKQYLAQHSEYVKV